jgi:DnaK suppressor protein
MRREEHASPMAMAPMLSAGTRGPRWRALLEARWQARLGEVTELSLAYHGAAAAGRDGHGDGDGQQETQRLLRRTVAARRKLADVDEALGRLAAGTFGYCEDCGSAIPAGLLAVIPETRYCPRCDTEPPRHHPRRRPVRAT